MAKRRANAIRPEGRTALPLAEDFLELVHAKLDRLLEQATPGDRRFLTIADAARYAGLSEESIRRMLSAGKLTALRPVSGRVVIDRRQLDAVVLGSDRQPRKGRGIRDASS